MYIPIHVRIHTHLQTHYTCAHIYTYTGDEMPHRSGEAETNAHGIGEVGGWGRVPFSRNLMKPTPRRKWYLTTGRRFH